MSASPMPKRPFVIPLDADNRLLPQAAEQLIAGVRKDGALPSLTR